MEYAAREPGSRGVACIVGVSPTIAMRSDITAKPASQQRTKPQISRYNSSE
jgi:hypothetical protein